MRKELNSMSKQYAQFTFRLPLDVADQIKKQMILNGFSTRSDYIRNLILNDIQYSKLPSDKQSKEPSQKSDSKPLEGGIQKLLDDNFAPLLRYLFMITKAQVDIYSATDPKILKAKSVDEQNRIISQWWARLKDEADKKHPLK